MIKPIPKPKKKQSISSIQKKELDRLYQTRALEFYNNQSILGGSDSLVIHHHKQGRTNAIRWYIPCGVPLVHWQHDEVHRGNYKGRELEKYYIIGMQVIWGKSWENKLTQRKYIYCDPDYEKVKDYLNGKIKDYI